MNFIKTISLVAALLLSFASYGWRIEKNILIIEKGDRLVDVAHSLLGRGTKYDLIWKKCIDTLISHTPNLIFDGMRFSIDSINTNRQNSALSVPIIYNEIKSPDESHIWDIVTAMISLLSVGLAAFLADYFFTRNEKRKIAFDLFSEFNSSEMHIHRVKADSLLAKNIQHENDLVNASDEDKKNHPEYFSNFEELDEKDLENKRSVYLILNFYKKIELLRIAKRIDSTLVPILFGEIFYYWWKYCFNKYATVAEWEALILVKNLNKWFDENCTDKQQESWKKANQYSHPHLSIAKKEALNIQINFDEIETKIRTIVTDILNEQKSK